MGYITNLSEYSWGAWVSDWNWAVLNPQFTIYTTTTTTTSNYHINLLEQPWGMWVDKVSKGAVLNPQFIQLQQLLQLLQQLLQLQSYNQPVLVAVRHVSGSDRQQSHTRSTACRWRRLTATLVESSAWCWQRASVSAHPASTHATHAHSQYDHNY